MKRSILPLLLASVALVAQSASAAVLYDRSNILTGTGNGFNGANTSAIAANGGSFGFGENGTVSPQVILADRFTLGTASTISSISFMGYSTSTYPFPPTSPFTSATMNIWSGAPGAPGSAILFTSNTLSMTAWTGIYRVQSTTLTNAQRPVFTLSIAFNNVALLAGSYYASWTVTGIVAPGATGSCFEPPVMNLDGTMPVGTALQSVDGGTTFTNLSDTTAGYQISVPITVNGTAIPEPSSVGLMLLSGAGLTIAAIRARRRG